MMTKITEPDTSLYTRVASSNHKAYLLYHGYKYEWSKVNSVIYWEVAVNTGNKIMHYQTLQRTFLT
jgi:hypothetical protein